MSRERVVVVLEYKIYVYNFADLNLLHTIETASNPRGLCSLCPDSRACVLACPGLQKGHVKAGAYTHYSPPHPHTHTHSHCHSHTHTVHGASTCVVPSRSGSSTTSNPNPNPN